ncbi:MAG: cupredoxin family copper-binding protein [Dehalococcoidia bacterium]|nr:cupredoxin family copper-binding protein [Dehalococcoidia bacterium]
MSKRTRILALAGLSALALAALAFAACGGDGEEEATPSPARTLPATTPPPEATAPTTPTTAVTPGETEAPESASVTIRDFEFDPAAVTIRAGGTVTWTNEGPSVHTATADDGAFDSGNLSRGDSFSQTFDEPGTYPYHCTPHPFMTAEVVVEE